MSYRVRLADAAVADIAELLDYVSRSSGWANADSMEQTIEAAIKSLAIDPARCAPVAGSAQGVRMLVTRQQTQILFAIDDDALEVIVLLVAHRGRDIAALLRMRP